MPQNSSDIANLASSTGRLRHRALGAQLLAVDFPGYGAVFYLSPIGTIASTPARGGVPVLFPQFAEFGPLRKHGYVRDVPWTLRESRQDDGGDFVCYTLDINERDYPQWPHSTSLQLKAELRANRLTIALRILNTGKDEFSFSGGLHPYFQLADLRQLRIEGLQGLPVRDRYRPELQTDEAAALSLGSEPFERLYDACPALQLRTPERRIMLSATGFDQWMVWNPGKEGAKQLNDLPDADWQHFVCIEPVRVARPVQLASGKTFSGVLIIEAMS